MPFPILPRPKLYVTPERVTALNAQARANGPRWRLLRDVTFLSTVGRIDTNNYSACYLGTGDLTWANRVIAQMVADAPNLQARIEKDDWFFVRDSLPSWALAYDWCRDRMTVAQQQVLQGTLERAAMSVWPETNPARLNAWGTRQWWGNYYHGFIVGTWLVWLALLGDSPLAEAGIALAKSKWQAALARLNVDLAGGYLTEGTNYGAGTLANILRYLTAHKTATNEDLTQEPWLKDALRLKWHLAAPDLIHRCPFGEQSSDYKGRLSPSERSGLLLATGIGFGQESQLARWMLDHMQPTASDNKVENRFEEFVFYNDQVTAAAPDGLIPPSVSSPGAGFVAARSSWQPDALCLQVICGAHQDNHQDRAAGGWVLWRGGDCLVGKAGQWSDTGGQLAAWDMNSLTVDSRDQNPEATTPKIVSEEHTDRYSQIVCEFGGAYDGLLISARRTFVLLKPEHALMVYDRIVKTNPARIVKWNLNTKSVPDPAWRTTMGQSQMVMNIVSGQTPVVSALSSSYRTEITGDSFLVVCQCGPTGFTPLSVTQTGAGAQIGDTEVKFAADGTATVVDHTVSLLEPALTAVYAAASDWMTGGKTVLQAGGVISAARALLDTLPRPMAGDALKRFVVAVEREDDLLSDGGSESIWNAYEEARIALGDPVQYYPGGSEGEHFHRFGWKREDGCDTCDDERRDLQAPVPKGDDKQASGEEEEGNVS